MDWKKTFAKALRDLIVTSVAVGGSAALVYFNDPEHLKHALASLPETVQLALIPLLSSAIVVLQNWLSHRRDLPVGQRRLEDLPK